MELEQAPGLSMTNPTIQDRLAGCLVGTAVGDALGAPLEHPVLPKELGAEYLLENLILIPGFPYGQCTDDSQLTIATAESIISRGRVDGYDIAQRFVRLWTGRENLRAGVACSQAIFPISSPRNPPPPPFHRDILDKVRRLLRHPPEDPGAYDPEYDPTIHPPGWE